MIYLKSLLVGLVVAVAAAVVWVLAIFIVEILMPFVVGRITNSGGVAFASVGSGSILAAALIGFVVGVSWQLRRLSKPRLPSR